MDKILSKNNNLIKDTLKLKEKKYRTQNGKFIIEGLRFVQEALKSDFLVEHIFISEKDIEKFKDILQENKNNSNVHIVEYSVFMKIVSTESPQGIAAVVMNKSFELSEEDGFYILVDKVQDPGNLGTIIRTAHASGALGLIYTKGTVDIYNEKTLRSTMGSIFKLPIIEEKNFEVINRLKAKNFKLLVSSLEAKNNYFEIDLKNKVILTVGNEGNGVSDEVLELGDETFKIPMPGDAESLNVAVAAAVMMFEIVRQNSIK